MTLKSASDWGVFLLMNSNKKTIKHNPIAKLSCVLLLTVLGNRSVLKPPFLTTLCLIVPQSDPRTDYEPPISCSDWLLSVAAQPARTKLPIIGSPRSTDSCGRTARTKTWPNSSCCAALRLDGTRGAVVRFACGLIDWRSAVRRSGQVVLCCDRRRSWIGNHSSRGRATMESRLNHD